MKNVAPVYENLKKKMKEEKKCYISLMSRTNITRPHTSTQLPLSSPPFPLPPLSSLLFSSPHLSSPLRVSASALYQFSSITSPAPLTAARSTVLLSFPLPLILTLIEVTMLTTVLPLCGCLLLNTNNNNNNIIQREWSCGGGCC